MRASTVGSDSGSAARRSLAVSTACSWSPGVDQRVEEPVVDAAPELGGGDRRRCQRRDIRELDECLASPQRPRLPEEATCLCSVRIARQRVGAAEHCARSEPSGPRTRR